MVDLQENYRLAEMVAPHVEKLRYNPGHLYHHEREKPWRRRSRTSSTSPREHDCAMRIGVNCGSRRSRDKVAKYDRDDSITPMLESALEHCAMLDDLGFDRYCVSLKDSDPSKVIEVNRRFADAAARRAAAPRRDRGGMPPDGIIKTRIAFEQLISRGIGDTIRVSLTLPVRAQGRGDRRPAGRSSTTSPPAASAPCRDFERRRLNIISCPSLLARRERGVHRAGAEREGDDRSTRRSTTSRSP